MSIDRAIVLTRPLFPQQPNYTIAPNHNKGFIKILERTDPLGTKIATAVTVCNERPGLRSFTLRLVTQLRYQTRTNGKHLAQPAGTPHPLLD